MTATSDGPKGTFLIEARRCKRCGGLLTSKQAVADGYGHVCKIKELWEREAREPMPGQMNLMDYFNDASGSGK